jgi:hypothetical protein
MTPVDAHGCVNLVRGHQGFGEIGKGLHGEVEDERSSAFGVRQF